jgi:hypothetical protein
LAMMEAAAMAAHLASPLTMASLAAGRPGGTLQQALGEDGDSDAMGGWWHRT